MDVIAAGVDSFSLKTLSTTESSVDVVSIPQNEAQSLTTIPAAMTSLPLFIVPALREHQRILRLLGQLEIKYRWFL